MTRPRLALYTLGLFGATVGILAVSACSKADPCVAQVMVNGKALKTASATATGACTGKVYLDSVGTDASGKMLLTLDSVGTDTT